MLKNNSKYIENKSDRFKRIASRRVDEILHKLRLLGNCSNTAIYEYREEDKRKIFFAIDQELKKTKMLFDRKGGEKAEFKL